jgi:hypothetical protein
MFDRPMFSQRFEWLVNGVKKHSGSSAAAPAKLPFRSVAQEHCPFPAEDIIGGPRAWASSRS